MWSTLAHLVFGKMKSPTYCVKAEEYTLAHCLLAPLKKFPSSDANPVQSPLAEFCVPCVPSGTWGNHPHSAVPQNRQAPWLPPVGPVWPVSAPGGGTAHLRPVRGRFGPHRGKFGRSHRRSREAGKLFSFFCFSQAGNKTHRSLKPTQSSPLGRASRAPARRCRSAQKAGRSRLPARSARGGPHRGPSPLHPLCRKERSL